MKKLGALLLLLSLSVFAIGCPKPATGPAPPADSPAAGDANGDATGGDVDDDLTPPADGGGEGY